MKQTLHILSETPSHESFKLCLQAVGKGDGIILIQDGVYALTQSIERLSEKIEEKELSISALVDDVKARGIEKADSKISQINYVEFVELTTNYQKTVSW